MSEASAPILAFVPGSCAFGSIELLARIDDPFRLCRLEPGDHESARYLSIAPLGQVPVLVDGEGVWTESASILQRLAGKTGQFTFAQGTADFDRLTMVLAYLTTSLHPGFGPVIHPERFSDEPSALEGIRQKGEATAADRLRHVDGLLNDDGRFFHSDTFLEPYVFGVARWADEFMDVDRTFPRIAALRQRLSGEDAHSFALAVEDDPTAAHPAYRGNVTLDDLVSIAERTGAKFQGANA